MNSSGGIRCLDTYNLTKGDTMPLPASGAEWPLAPFGMMFDQYRVNAAWYEGNLDELSRIYSPTTEGAAPGDAAWRNGVLMTGGLTGLGRTIRKWFNGQPVTHEVTRIHSPLAGNLASLSSDLLFAEPPSTRIVVEGKRIKGASQNRLDQLLNSDAAYTAMSRAGEYAAGLGATAYSWAWDKDLADSPWLQAHAADAVIPEFRSGLVVAITVFDTYMGTGDTVWRHLMRHEPGAIVHGLYMGKRDKLGKLVKFGSKGAPSNLDYLAGVAGATTDADGSVSVPTGTQLLTAAFQLNLPTRSYRREGLLSNMGRADTEGAEGFLDAHDETWSSWLRDIKLARARLLVPDTFLEGKGAGNGAYFNEYAEVFTGLNDLNLGDDLARTIVPQQFEIRHEAHRASALAEVAEVLQHAGYSGSSYGDSDEAANVATDVVDRARKSERTRDKKARYARMALTSMARSGLELFAAVYGVATGDGAQVKLENIEVSFPDISQIDPEKQARTFQYLKAADAISVETTVRERNPDWDVEEVAAEVTKILERTKLPDPFAIGVTPPDPDEQERLENQGGNNDDGNNDEQGATV